MTDAQSAGNKTKYAYYFTTYSDTCQIRNYSGNNTCAGLHADGVQSLAAGNEKNYLTNMSIWESKRCKTLIEDDYVFYPFAALNLAETFEWATLPESTYVNTNLKCAALKTKMTDAQSAGNKTKYAYYYTTWSDTCQIRSYNGQNTCAGLHADGVQSLAAGNEKNYLTNMAIWAPKGCKTLIADDYVFYPFAAPVVVEEPVYVDPVVVVDTVVVEPVAPVATCGTWSIQTYFGGAQVCEGGRIYECKAFPLEGWCGQATYCPTCLNGDDAWTDMGVYPNEAAPLADTFEWATLPESTYVNTNLKCAALKTKMTDAQSAGNKTKYAYYFTTYSDTCQIRNYSGNNTCAGLHADGVQSLAAGNEKNYLTNMAIWESKRCKTLIEDDYIFAPIA